MLKKCLNIECLNRTKHTKLSEPDTLNLIKMSKIPVDLILFTHTPAMTDKEKNLQLLRVEARHSTRHDRTPPISQLFLLSSSFFCLFLFSNVLRQLCLLI